jgi:hypothetical protein
VKPHPQKHTRGPVSTAFWISDKVLWWLAERIPVFSQLVARRERSVARKQCVVLLDICRELQDEDPALEGEHLYERVVARRLSCDEVKAREIVRAADQSFAQWPHERDVIFRDVVNFLIVNYIMLSHVRALGTQVDMVVIVNATIPEGL